MIIAYGEILWDLLPNGRQLGGAVANCAARLVELGNEVQLVSSLGSDELGTEARSLLEEKGLDCSLIQQDPIRPTGTVPVTLSAHGVPEYVITPEVAYDYISYNDSLAKAARQAEFLIYGTLAQRNSISRSSLAKLLGDSPASVKILDVNLRDDCFTEETLRQSLFSADIIKLNDEELATVLSVLDIAVGPVSEALPALARRCQATGILLSRGANGVCAFHEPSREYIDLPGIAVTVVDTIGCGDTFTAGFVDQLRRGNSFRGCCEFANLLAAQAATTPGGMTPLPGKSSC